MRISSVVITSTIVLPLKIDLDGLFLLEFNCVAGPHRGASPKAETVPNALRVRYTCS